MSSGENRLTGSSPRSPPPRWLVIGGAITAVAAATFLVIAYLRNRDPSDPSDETFTVQPPAGTDRYVALGDSYSAGEGVRPYEEGSGDADRQNDDCHRSTLAYARRLELAEGTEVAFRACSGAEVRHVYEEPQPTSGGFNRYGEQVRDGVVGSDVGLVTFTMGGNDAAFSQVLNHCFFEGDCLTSGEFVTEDFGAPTLRAWAGLLFPRFETDLDELFEELRADAENARIVVIGYPHLFPDGGIELSPDCQRCASAGPATSAARSTSSRIGSTGSCT